MATDLNSSRRSTLSSNASQLRGVKIDCLLIIFRESEGLIVEGCDLQPGNRTCTALICRRRSYLRVVDLSARTVGGRRCGSRFNRYLDLVQVHVITRKKCLNDLGVEFEPSPFY